MALKQHIVLNSNKKIGILASFFAPRVACAAQHSTAMPRSGGLAGCENPSRSLPRFLSAISIRRGVATALALWLLPLWNVTVLAQSAPPDALVNALHALQNCGSVHVNFTATMGIQGTLPEGDYMTGSLTYVQKPVKIKGSVTAVGNTVEFYGEQVDQQVRAYVNAGGVWKAEKRPMEIDVTSFELPAEWVERMQNVTWADAQPIDGKPVKELTATVDLRTLLSNAMVSQAMGFVIGEQANAEALPEDFAAQATFSIFMEDQSNRPLRMEADLSEAVSALASSMMPNQPGVPQAGLSIAMVLRADFVDYGIAEDFEIPAEAKSE